MDGSPPVLLLAESLMIVSRKPVPGLSAAALDAVCGARPARRTVARLGECVARPAAGIARPEPPFPGKEPAHRCAIVSRRARSAKRIGRRHRHLRGNRETERQDARATPPRKRSRFCACTDCCIWPGYDHERDQGEMARRKQNCEPADARLGTDCEKSRASHQVEPRTKAAARSTTMNYAIAIALPASVWAADARLLRRSRLHRDRQVSFPRIPGQHRRFRAKR